MTKTTRKPALTVAPLNFVRHSDGRYEANRSYGEGRYIVRPFQGSRWEVVAVNAHNVEFPVAECESAADGKEAAALDAYEFDLKRAIEATKEVSGWDIDSDARMGNLYVTNPNPAEGHDDDCIYAVPFWIDQDSGEVEETLIAQRHVVTPGDDLFSDNVDTGVRWTGNLETDVAAWRAAVAKLIADLPVVK